MHKNFRNFLENIRIGLKSHEICCKNLLKFESEGSDGMKMHSARTKNSGESREQREQRAAASISDLRSRRALVIDTPYVKYEVRSVV